MKKIEKILFYIFLFLIPFNIKKFVVVLFKAEPLTEFNALFLYLSDILLVLLLALWLLRTIKTKQIKIKKPPLWGYFLFFFVVFLLFSLVSSQNLILTSYYLVKFSLIIGLFFYVKYNLLLLRLENILKIIVFGGFIQSIIALGQHIKQSSLGLKYLGESWIASGLPGIAKLDISSIKIIRSYGTFAHPNILACFLLLALYGVVYLVLKRKDVYLFFLPVISLGLILTFSRSIIFLGLLSLIISLIYVYLKIKKKGTLRPLFVLLASFVVFSLVFLPYLTERFDIQKEEQAVSLRMFYNQVSYEMIKKTPLLGVGLGNFTNKFRELYPELEDWQYQPVHNIYLLMFSEMGIFGLVSFLGFLFLLLREQFKSKNRTLETIIFLSLIIVILLIGSVDHFFLTINQGMILFWLTLGVFSTRLRLVH